MDKVVLLAVAGVTSLMAFVLGARAFGLPRTDLVCAVTRALEFVGATLIFFVANLGLTFAVLVAVRSLTPVFLPLYIASDLTLLPISLVQALVFEAWRGSSRS